MNHAVLCGRLTRDPETRQTSDKNATTITRYTLAVNRISTRGQDADYINIVAFGSAGEFAAKYFRQGMRVLISGNIETGSYINKNGDKVNTFCVVAKQQEFADSKESNE